MIQDIDIIRKIKKEMEPMLLKIPGVTGVDIGYKSVNGKKTNTLAIIIYVTKKQDVDKKNFIPKKLKDVPTDVIERNFVLYK